MAQYGKEYGVDYAQDEVPPYELFGLVYTITEGRLAEEEIALDRSVYTAYAYANIKAFQIESSKPGTTNGTSN